MNHTPSLTEDHVQQATRLRNFLRWLFLLTLLSALLELLGGLLLKIQLLDLASVLSLGLVGTAVLAYRLTWWDALRPAVLVMCAGFLAAILCAMVLVPVALPALTVAVLLPATIGLPYLDRRSLGLLLLCTGVVGVLVTVLARLPFIQQLFPPLPPLIADGLVIVAVVISLTLTLMLLWQFSTRLTETLTQTQAANAALLAAQTELEAQVAARTAALQTTVDQLQASQATIREIGAPVLPIAPGVLVAPLIGALDDDRAASLAAKLLPAVQQRRAYQVILDITGVPFVDRSMAQALMQIAGAVQLLGAQVSIVGIRAEVAQGIVQLDLDLPGIATFSDLQSALAQFAPRSLASQN